jgi:hypothetical protein
MIKYHLPLLFSRTPKVLGVTGVILLAVFTGSLIGLFFCYECPADPARSLLDPYTDGVMRGAS